MAKKTVEIPMGDPILAIALSKAVKDAATKAARSELTVGTHNVDFSCRVKGSLTVGEDEEYTPTVAVPLLPTIAFFLRRCGITREYALQALTDAMKDALEMNKPGAENVKAIVAKDEEIIKEMMQQVTGAMESLPKKTRAGKITTALEVSPV